MQFELRNVIVEFSAFPALDSVSLRIEPESMVLVTGPTGSGKTTLLRLLYGELLPTRGSVFINGQETSVLRFRQLRRLRSAMGISFQDGRLLDDLSVYDNVRLVLLLRKVPTQHAHRRTLDALVRLGISYLRDKVPSECSMGERQLVGMAHALACQPDTIIVDEPTGFLDVEATAIVAQQLVQEHERGATIIVATHDPFFAAQLPATQRIALYEGRLVSHEIPA